MEYHIYIESDDDVTSYAEPVIVMTPEEAVATAAGILRARPGGRSAQVYRDGLMVATIEG